MPDYGQYGCPHCGGPLPPPPTGGVVHCPFCSRELAPSHLGWRLLSDEELDPLTGDLNQLRLWVQKSRYALIGRIAEGKTSDVFLARRDNPLTERVVIKVLRDHQSESKLQHEWHVAQHLSHGSTRGTDFFRRLLPQPVNEGVARVGARGELGTRRVWVYRYKSGFAHTLQQVMHEYPKGVPVTAAVWIWKRVVEVLSFMHEAGYSHRQLTADHVLLHVRDHGAALVGLSSASGGGSEQDLVESAQLITSLLGKGDCPAPVAKLLQQTVRGAHTKSGWQLLEEISQVAEAAFGPPKYIHLPVSGW